MSRKRVRQYYNIPYFIPNTKLWDINKITLDNRVDLDHYVELTQEEKVKRIDTEYKKSIRKAAPVTVNTTTVNVSETVEEIKKDSTIKIVRKKKLTKK